MSHESCDMMKYACDFELKIRTIQILFNFYSKNRSRVKILRWLKIRIEIEFDPKWFDFELSQNFRTKKVSLLRINTWSIFRVEINFEPSQNHMYIIYSIFHHITWFTWQITFDDFVSNFKVTPVPWNAPKIMRKRIFSRDDFLIFPWNTSNMILEKRASVTFKL